MFPLSVIFFPCDSVALIASPTLLAFGPAFLLMILCMDPVTPREFIKPLRVETVSHNYLSSLPNIESPVDSVLMIYI